MRLGVIYEPEGANPYYRAIIPLRALERSGHSVVWPTKVDSIPMGAFAACDLVHCYRRLDRAEDLKTLAERGVAISFDNDDDIAAAEMSLGGKGLAGHLYNRGLFREILAAAAFADVTTTPSEQLAERYRAAGARNVAVIDNYLDPMSVGLSQATNRNGVVLGWVAAREHKLDAERLPIVEPLKRLLDLHPNLHLLTIGVRLPLHSERYEHIPYTEFVDLPKAIAGIDIGIAPLADNAFNRSRSSVKLKEYGAAGAAWLASPVGPYQLLGSRQGGLLVDDDEWFAAVDELVRNPRQLKRLAKRARKWAGMQTIDRFASRWEDAFHLAIETAAQRSAARIVAR